MAGEVLAGLSAVKAAFDLAKGLKDINDATTRNAAVIELQEQILTAQAAQSSLIERIRELEKEVTRLEAWETEKQRYTLTEVGTGAFALVVRPSMQGTEPTHCICADCYERSEKSILQMVGNAYGSVTLRCPRCKTDVRALEDHPDYPLKRVHAPDPKERARAGLEVCVICGTGRLAVVAVGPHPIFGDMGIQERTLKCDNAACAHSEKRQHDPSNLLGGRSR
jgi:Zn finger protein HypA/HybF involved in hydrogenase expression